MSTKDPTPAPYDHIVATEFEGSEGVLVDLKAKRYYQLNETAMFIWRCLDKGHPLSEIVEEMTQTYEVTSEQAAASIERLLLELKAHQLIAAK